MPRSGILYKTKTLPSVNTSKVGKIKMNPLMDIVDPCLKISQLSIPFLVLLELLSSVLLECVFIMGFYVTFCVGVA